MKKYYSIVLMLLCLTAIGQTKNKEGKERAVTSLTLPPLQLHIEVDKGTGDGSTLRVSFENISKNKVTLLRHFSPLPVFFSFNLTKEDGTPIGWSGGGKISLGPNIQYITLEPEEFFGFRIQLSDVFDKLDPGKYQLTVLYHNQYGKDCYQGQLKSNSVEWSYLPKKKEDDMPIHEHKASFITSAESPKKEK